jgi:hypothetical protein
MDNNIFQQLALIFDILIGKTGSMHYSINPILVHQDIRKSYLIQPIDDCIKKFGFNKMIQLIKKHFPNFNFIKMDQGILVTKEEKAPFDIHKYSEKELGEFLSYPCAGDILADRNYIYKITATYNNQFGYYDDDIICMICNDPYNNKELKDLTGKIIYVIMPLNIYLTDKIQYDIKINKLNSILDLVDIINKNDVVDNKNEILNIFNNYEFSIMSIIYDCQIADIFDLKYRELIVKILNFCYQHSINKKSEMFTDIRSKVDYICHIFNKEYNHKINDDIIDEAMDFYN